MNKPLQTENEFTKDFHDGNQCSGVSTLELNKTDDELTEEQKVIAWEEYIYQQRMLERENY